MQLILYPALVQGEGAAESIVNGIRCLDDMGLDVLIVGRGGGSIEDLWAFNEEIVARAIFECRTPVISAVGHETDTTIADFVADLRAPTPSAAAELAVFKISDIMEELGQFHRQFLSVMEWKIETAKNRSRQIGQSLLMKSPQNQLNEKRQYLLSIEEKLEQLMQNKIMQKKYRLGIFAERLDGVSPAKKLSQGMAFVTDISGKRLSRVSGISAGDEIKVRFADGTAFADVKKTVPFPGQTERKGSL